LRKSALGSGPRRRTGRPPLRSAALVKRPESGPSNVCSGRTNAT
jgi:hypothetical protein